MVLWARKQIRTQVILLLHCLNVLGIQLVEAGRDGQIWLLSCQEPSEGYLKDLPLLRLWARVRTSGLT